MEASGTPTPPADPPQASPPPPRPPAAPAADDSASGGWRALGVILAIALAFACAVMVIAMVEVGDNPACQDLADDPAELAAFLAGEQECIGELTVTANGAVLESGGSSAQKTATLIFGWPSAVLAGLAALMALFFAATGRQGRLLLQLTGAAIALGAISIVIGYV